jgi:hypothetical protein
MKVTRSIIGTFLLAASALGQLQVQERTMEDFQLGVNVTSCLIVNCQVFSGFLTTDLPKSGDALYVRVQEWLFGDSVEAELLPVAWEERLSNGGLTGALSDSWKVAVAKKGSFVTVVSGHENGIGVRKGEAVLVTDDQREAGIIRMLAAEARKAKRSPASVGQLAASLSEHSNAALAGFIYTYAVLSIPVTDREQRAELLLGLVANPKVPKENWVDITSYMLMHYYAVSGPARVRIVHRLAQLGGSADEAAAEAAFMGLAKIAAIDDLAVRTLVSPREVTKLDAAYRALRKKGAISRLPSLEAEFENAK